MENLSEQFDVRSLTGTQLDILSLARTFGFIPRDAVNVHIAADTAQAIRAIGQENARIIEKDSYNVSLSPTEKAIMFALFDNKRLLQLKNTNLARTFCG